MPRRYNKDEELGRLCAAMWRARLQLRWARQTRVAMVREELGAHYSEDANEKTTPINIMSMAARIILNKLVPKNPRVLLSTFERRYRPAVSIMEDWANNTIEQLNLANTFRRIVKDALYCVGIAKVGIASPGDAQFADWSLKAGQPFIERIDLDDLVYDIHARDWSECGYIGHRIRLPVDVVHTSGMYKLEGGAIEGGYDEMFNHEGDERISMIGRGYYSQDEEYDEFCDLWEVWDRRRGVIITLLDQDTYGAGAISAEGYKSAAPRKALRVQKWLGPDSGPYHFLGFNVVPGNPMPKGPLQDIFDLSMAINGGERKIADQARNTKRITLVDSGSTEDGKRVGETEDGGMCVINGDPKGIVQVVMNEPNQPLILLVDRWIQHASKLMGNLDLIGGLGPQSKTLGQDQINMAASASSVGSMQEDTTSFIAKVLESWLWFHHYHPTNVHETHFSLADRGLPRVGIVRRSFPNNPDVHQNDPNVTVRRHRFEEMQIKVDPYSMQHQTPQDRAKQLVDAVRNIYLPMAMLAQQQGVGLDLNAFFRKLGKYLDDPDFDEIFQFQEKPAELGGGNGQGGNAAGVGPESAPGGSKDPTEIIRRSLGADSQQAQQSTMANAMRAAAGQNGQVQQIGGAA